MPLNRLPHQEACDFLPPQHGGMCASPLTGADKSLRTSKPDVWGGGGGFSGWSVPVLPPSLRKALVIVANLSPAGTKPGSVPQPLRQVSYLTFRTAM